jgi:hypothetical protein
LFREFVAHKALATRRNEAAVFLAWKTADLMRCQKLPELKTLLNKAPVGPHRQSMREMRDNVEALSKLIGVPLQKAKGKRTAG